MLMANKSINERKMLECLIDIKNIFSKKYSDELIRNAVDHAFNKAM